MRNLTARRYVADDAAQWNTFIGKARNATFLFDRRYMDYHADRFADCSVIVEEDGKWLAVLPANREGTTVASHRGLTYGGLVYGNGVRLEVVVEAFAAALAFLEKEGIRKLFLKTIPAIYHEKPSQETEYALFLSDGKLVRRDTLSVIDLSLPFSFATDRKAGVKRGGKAGLTLSEDTDPVPFWESLLVPSLRERHGAAPVHSAEEMQRLMAAFPDAIRLFTVSDGSRIVAGTVLYVSPCVVHSQYIASDGDRNKNGSLDFLHARLLEAFAGKKRWFDFGISNESNGKLLNGGLSYWKESFGCGTVIHDFYEVDTANHVLLKNFLR